MILKNDWIYKDSNEKETYSGTPIERLYKCTGGFGCDAKTNGTHIGGFLVHSCIKFAIRGYGYMERIATKQEIDEAYHRLTTDFTVEEITKKVDLLSGGMKDLAIRIPKKE